MVHSELAKMLPNNFPIPASDECAKDKVKVRIKGKLTAIVYYIVQKTTYFKF